ncbi:hypothetical protein IQ264_15790 [Phormidium sp. LEGE 05292]|uniref:hypothetical protein n=1 Tax=[Phormidium] sp. LEGE 05292 TaxID=767427 RepID=UPI001881AA0C|nr:hypothetical protein [Phormidium sp. LEGE 05292]MBE9226889.1 hypothetical protein [Phormidium sp. LEGE 05292]
MSLEDLQTDYREALDETLNHLNVVNLLVAQIESKMEEVRDSMLTLCQVVEQIIETQNQQ